MSVQHTATTSSSVCARLWPARGSSQCRQQFRGVPGCRTKQRSFGYFDTLEAFQMQQYSKCVGSYQQRQRRHQTFAQPSDYISRFVHGDNQTDVDKHARAAREGFLENLRKGEAGMDVATAALQVAAEDDALVSHSSVGLPIKQYLKRIEKYASELQHHHLTKLPPDAAPADVLAVVDDYLFNIKGLRASGRNPELLPGDVLDHPGVWEDARDSYLNCVLTRRRGSPAALAIVYSEVMRRLLTAGAVSFPVRMVLPSTPTELPRPEPLLHLSRSQVVIGASMLNTCSSAALVDLLRHLKRAYWPFRWDTREDAAGEGMHGSSGGFTGAAEALLGGLEAQDAFTQAVARTARHRLDRGIWTSSGAGDMRRARAACERLAAVAGGPAAAEGAAEDRDLAVLLTHLGDLGAADHHLRLFHQARAQHPGIGGSPAQVDLAERLHVYVKACIAEGAPLLAPPPPPLPIPW